jgi:DNA-binding transcriptional regulator/RsmH inhibitor MraZ
VETGVEVKKVDAQGRLILPADWRKSELSENKELYIIKRKGYLKTIPKQHIDLTENFDKLDLGVDPIGDWKEFEKRLNA